MKVLLALLLLAGGCSVPASPAQSAVEAYLKKTLDDPASYQPVRWGKAGPWRQSGADTLAAVAKALAMRADYEHGQSFIDSCTSGQMFADEDTARQGHDKRSGIAAGARYDKNLEQLKRLQSSSDTTRLGVVLRHVFRAKNKMGALVLDSARFTVMSNGTVTAMRLP